MKDLLGKAIFDFQTNNQPEKLYTETSISNRDEMDIAYMFRTYDEMPLIEQKALDLSYGRILDIGCGAGSHALHLQALGHEVVGLDNSAYAVKTCQLRGLQQVVHTDVLSYHSAPFDTLLLLMNGTGIFGTLNQVAAYLQHLKGLLTDNGQILIDSSDLIYMFDEDEDGGKWIPWQGAYYGELTFKVFYKGEQENAFPWLYLDYNTLQNACIASGLQCELITEGSNFDYLARITKSHTQ